MDHSVDTVIETPAAASQEHHHGGGEELGIAVLRHGEWVVVDEFDSVHGG